MRLKKSITNSATTLYVIKSTYDEGKNSSKIVERLGTLEELALTHSDPEGWAREYIKGLNQKEKEERLPIALNFSPVKSIAMGEQKTFNGAYLFLQEIYSQLKLPQICQKISEKYAFDFDLNLILSRLIYSRILFPDSKLATCELAQKFIENKTLLPHRVYRSLDVLAKEMDVIQAELYKNSQKIVKRQTGILYYDCTNYFFEIHQEDDFRKYGKSKENRPNPIVQMGLFMDYSGIPLAFNLQAGATIEQITLKPLEKKILKDFELSKFIVCTDAGLSSLDNRKFNDKADRGFVTTQSLKMMTQAKQTWALNPEGWKLPGKSGTYNLENLDTEDKNFDEAVFYKEEWLKEKGLNQRYIVTFSLKYRAYQRQVRKQQIARAIKEIGGGKAKIKTRNANDYRRFIRKIDTTENGEIIKNNFSLDEDKIHEEEKFDGFYCVATNIEADEADIIKINQGRWEIEESFQIMKTEFEARPVYLQREDRIRAHFLTCFIALLIFRLLEKKLHEKFTASEIMETLREMNFYKIHREGFLPAYTRSPLTDQLHEAFDFRTDYEIVTLSQMRKIISKTKSN